MVDYITIPTYLTLVRLCAAPVILPVFFALLLPYNNIFVNCFLAMLFGLFGFTDFLDGFLARYYRQESALGKALDPIADKFLMFSSLIGLLVAQKIFFIWVLIFVGRDIFMMGLRQIGLEYAIEVSVSSWGKIRTAVLMLYIAFVILNPYVSYTWADAPWWQGIEFTLLLVALFLTIWSTKKYVEAFLIQYKSRMSH